MPQLLLELFSEEIPAGMQLRAAQELQNAVQARLDNVQVAYESFQHFATPRRITLVVDGLPKQQSASTTEKRGPRVGAPENAIDGFLKSSGLERVSQLEIRNTDKGDFYFAVTQQGGRAVAEVLVETLQDVLNAFTWPKSMKWGSRSMRWVRPLHNILCIFGGDVLPLNFGHLRANNKSFGHRFMAPDSFTVANFNEYRSRLKEAYVILETEERKRTIMDQATKQAKVLGLQVKQDQGLLDEVAGLVEWPVVLVGHIDERFMVVPEEVLTTSMRSHQKYFSLQTHEGRLAPHFATVSNMAANDKGARIIHGNERVLKARLEDAKFFWDQDRRNSLESRLPELSKIVFHAKLGTVAEKTTRVEGLAKLLAMWIPHANLMKVERAARLCKTDLTTSMVTEFPELQGLMGCYYALESKEDEQIADAICEHYSPVGPNDQCPTAPVSVAVALADKIDTLVGLFAVDEKPTGSRDPYALRRAALGVIRIILENKLSIPLRLLFEKSISRYPKKLFKAEKAESKKIVGKIRRVSKKQEQVIAELLLFFADRLRVSLRDKNVRHDLIEAVFDGGNEDDLARLVVRVRALEMFLSTEDGKKLHAAYKRANNIVVAEEKKDKQHYDGAPSRDLLVEDEEIDLYKAFKEMKPRITKYLKEDDFRAVMKELAKLQEPIDHFFEKVTVNSESKSTRKNRLLLLSQYRSFLNQVANFSKIEG